jgi:catechol 2,3-dioxygenase-like lactoylglutathione lyase family enzyme
MRVSLTSVVVDDQDKALKFYTETLGFVKKQDFPAGGARCITMVSPEGHDAVELALEPCGFDFARDFKNALYEKGIPFTAFASRDLRAEYERLKAKGVQFRGEPKQIGPVLVATFDDTCGNLIQLFEA